MSSPTFVPVVSSLLENDLYKFTMWQALLHSHPAAHAEYEFTCRNKPQYALSELADELNHQLDHLCTLRFSEEELDYLRGLRFIKPDFVDFLSLFHLQRKFITVSTEGEHLRVHAVGPMVHTMPFEIFVLQIVNEIYFRRFDDAQLMEEGVTRLLLKVDLIKKRVKELATNRPHPFEFFDFGLRRRFSAKMQDIVVSTLAHELPEHFKGTSNVHLARKYNLVPIGTHAHEWFGLFQAQATVRLRNFQRAALQAWVDEYRGDLGTALTDMIGMDAFLSDFDLYFAKLFDSLRHDSGDPVAWGEKALAHYAKLKIDANTKRLVFSDGLDVDRAFELYDHFVDRTMMGFGIGTNLTNDMGVPALSIVMKLVGCNGQPVCKISDNPDKTSCSDPTFVAYLRQIFDKPA
ncbi:nicotinate phosphoribosyltransferase [Janthinobacterium sp. 64]|uniref:nicotinate phosphoribosyltransferase n=1 Tax=Janthinobacterium sp. 64 TaxID=2035208 RepID=UPI000C2BAED4|nr:nicotinate phosphoribosyltransferase [Janthinobacterium sp. 64]PKB24077.1 nicotinate phosphoribosyltransferase [Janthinobacterium sp. 64]